MAVDIRKRIRDLRKARGMSAKDVSEKMGISRPFYTQLEGGTRRLSVRYLEGIARALGTTVSELYSEQGVPAATPYVSKNVTDGGVPALAEKLRPFLGDDSEKVAESVQNYDRAARSLRNLKINGRN